MSIKTLPPKIGGNKMAEKELTCARSECGETFTRVTHNQKYCSNLCCRIETNRKIMEKYHERAAIKRGKKRQCKGCDTPLSRYNQNNICAACEIKAKADNVGEAANLLASVVWL